MAARINYDEAVYRFAIDTAAYLDAEQMRWAAENWEEYFDLYQVETDDPDEIRARFESEWRSTMLHLAEQEQSND